MNCRKHSLAKNEDETFKPITQEEILCAIKVLNARGPLAYEKSPIRNLLSLHQ